MIKKFRVFVLAHKFISVIIAALVVGGGYYAYASSHGAVAVTQYVIQEAAQGTVVSSVTGSGQVQAASTINVNPQVSETVDSIAVKVGDHVTAGQLLMQLATMNEAKALTQAQLSYQLSQLSLQKLQEAPATTTLLQDQDSITQDGETIANASTTLQRDYQSGFGTLSTSFIDFQTVMVGLQDFVGGNEVTKAYSNPDAFVNLLPTYLQESAKPYLDQLQANYSAASAAYTHNLADYHAANVNSSNATLDSLFTESVNTANEISATVKAGKDLLDYVINNYPGANGTSSLPSVTNSFQANLGNYTNTINGDISSITNAENSIASDKTAITNDTLSLSEAQDNLTELQSGPDPLDLQSQQLSIEQSQISLQTAEGNLADDSVRAPISGIVSAISAIVGETVPSPAVTIVSDGQIAEVTLNEVDAAKVSVGNEATLTFNAITGLSLAGQVVEIDPVGTVSQGVVNYNVQIGFSQPANTSSSNQVKPGMSVTADIVTQADQNVIALPNGAVKTEGGASYVLEPASPVSTTTLAASAAGGVTLDTPPQMVPVTVGLSNDTMTEITSGVNVGDQVITQTITTTASAGAAPATGGTSALQLLRGGGATGVRAVSGGGGFRAGGGG